ncbi:DNA-binding LacI/PurR family transcriptional regulator [Kibdelosporangium banguiense]|uniref:DNA-binding LacI/PurR family transcriptional regulator n=1 Tax=Kibdelosporangium banguiense TaxID=1365924 RepID=A0ABS4TRF4_9PSEU|nr:LacI family DNA-binding transcriptional regulator [Kibdelosporangium banguiense]MBP2326977.1 DNA-binding LacI/PurR family transcriptional regulator [Kibdelosporangium banguiense]
MRGDGRRLSIVDVAAVAGVSRQTVSNVINGRDSYYSEATFERVTAAMRSLGFQPNRAAQALRSRRTMQIGYHIFGEQLDIMQGFTLHFLQALVKASAEAGNQMLVFTHHRDDPLGVFKDLVARRAVDAVILSESRVDDERARLLADSGMPFACFGRLAPGLPQQWVDVDNVAGMQPLVDLLVAEGHQRFAYLGADGDQYWKAERLEGFAAGLARHGLRVPKASVYRGPDDGIRKRTRQLLTGRNPPSAIVTSSDYVGAMVVNVAHSLGLTVGSDVAVTGFDGGAIGLMTEPSLTCARIPVERIAQELVARCLRQVEGGPNDDAGLLLPTEVVRGGSA